MSTPAKPSTTQQEKGNRPGPPRRFDEHILRWVGYHGFVTLQQVVHRFWIHRGVGGKYGYRCVAKLVADGALTQRLLQVGGDNSTPRVVSLAPQGYRQLGLDPRQPRTGAGLQHHIRYRIQGAEVMLEREPDGWTVIPKDDQDRVVRAIREYALKPYRGRALDSYSAAMHSRIERLRPRNLQVPVSILWHPERKDVRLFLPLRRGRSYKAHLEKVQDLRFLPSLSFEAICIDPNLLIPATKYVQRWGQRRRVHVTVHSVGDFRRRANPIQHWKHRKREPEEL